MKTINEVKERCHIDDQGHWLWRGATAVDGSPRIHAPDLSQGGILRVQQGRRSVWQMRSREAVPAGWRVYSLCGEQCCVRPEHIGCGPMDEVAQHYKRLGVYSDWTRRSTASRIASAKRTKATPAICAAVLASDETGLAVAKRLGISKSLVSRIRRGERNRDNVFRGLLVPANDGMRSAA